jgi:ribosomal-protein-alanine N-acetyltransferase
MMRRRRKIEADIVTATLADAEAIAALHRQCFDDAWGVATIRALLQEESAVALVARSAVGGSLAGFVLCRLAADECEMLSCATAQSFRCRGVASRLLDAALAEVIWRGGRQVFLEVAVNNDAARALYAACGFRSVGRRPGYYLGTGSTVAVDALIMHREL